MTDLLSNDIDEIDEDVDQEELDDVVVDDDDEDDEDADEDADEDTATSDFEARLAAAQAADNGGTGVARAGGGANSDVSEIQQVLIAAGNAGMTVHQIGVFFDKYEDGADRRELGYKRVNKALRVKLREAVAPDMVPEGYTGDRSVSRGQNKVYKIVRQA